jgi:hypothetical protein
LVVIVVWHKLLTGSIFQTARERDLFPDTKAICETNFREAQVAHLVRFFIWKTSGTRAHRNHSRRLKKAFGNKTSSGTVFISDGTDLKVSLTKRKV